MDYLSVIGIFIIAFQITTAIIGSIYYYKYKDTFLKYFLIVLWYIAINDLLGYTIKSYLNDQIKLSIIYNIYYLVVFNYLLFLFRNYVTSNIYRKCVSIFIVIYNLTYIISAFFENYLIEFATISYIIGASLIVVSIIFYYIDILNSEKVLYVNRNLLFWISIGELIYYGGNVPFRIVRNYGGKLSDASTQFLALCVLTFIMNLCFIIGFICSRNKQQY